ncbi:protein Dok-7-like [Hoplias malabaricus]|uniref:protein Dok-7-like n=1 Tax=Hoplias malabaricus TaxID=27720 RepID=UPI0034621DB6
MTDSAVAEGHVKLRDGKKWKSRWVVLRKPSPVADCLVLLVSKERGAKERSSVVLEHICGLEAGQSGEGVAFTLTILCLSQTVQLGFDSKEALLAWDIRLRYYLGEVHSFNVAVLPGTKLESGPATLHLCNSLLVIARGIPPVIVGQWNLLDLRRYGPVTNGFVFEGGTRKPSTKYAQIDITATETAHRVGTQHALGREEGLQRLEQRRRGGASLERHPSTP